MGYGSDANLKDPALSRIRNSVQPFRKQFAQKAYSGGSRRRRGDIKKANVKKRDGRVQGGPVENSPDP